jgi:pimeloyl-ACP methyl ester carboxylesterase
MTGPVLKARTLVTDDGVPIDAIHLPGDKELAIVLAHGFTLSWQRPAVWRVATHLNRSGGVVTFDFRGHGRSGGLSTVGDLEIKDLDVAVAYARELGYRRVAAVGFSMGASIVVRYAGLVGGLDAAVSVSGPGRWYYRGTKPMRRVHWAVERRAGRLVTRTWLKTRVAPTGWNPVPVPPSEAAALITPTPFLVVHGDQDLYFPVEHAYQLYEAASEPRELWVVPGFGHAESGISNGLVDRIGRWIHQAVQLPDGAPAGPERAAQPEQREQPAGPGTHRTPLNGAAMNGAADADGAATNGAADADGAATNGAADADGAIVD